MTPCAECLRDGMCVAYCAAELAAAPGWIPEPSRLTLRRQPRRRPVYEPSEDLYHPSRFKPPSQMLWLHHRAEIEATAAGRPWRPNPVDMSAPGVPCATSLATGDGTCGTVPAAESPQSLKK